MRFTSHNNPAILVGDLNFEPEDVGYRFLTTALHLKDAWLEAGDEVWKSLIYIQMVVVILQLRHTICK